MLNPSSLYEFRQNPDPHRPGVLLVGVEGFMDAGHTVRLLGDHLLDTTKAEHLVTFDIDQVYDYRGRRPAVVFDQDHFESFERPKLNLYRLTDRDGQTYYLLRGAEPDFQWERVSAAVLELIRTFGVTQTITWQGVPMAVPHTRPLSHSMLANDPSLLPAAPSPFGRVQIPGSFSNLLHLRLKEAGHKAVGVTVHVPHYLSDNDYPDAALEALNTIQDAADLNLPNDALVAAVTDSRLAITEALQENSQVTDLVQAIESQYDEFVASKQAEGLGIGPAAQQLPSADELGAEFEAFLKNVDDGPVGDED